MAVIGPRDIGLSELITHFHDDGTMSATLVSIFGTNRVTISGDTFATFSESYNRIQEAMDETRAIAISLLNPKASE